MKLLAVDDDPMILELLLETLPSLGFADVIGAGSAAEAMQIISTAPAAFDGFLFDIQMPDMTGIELCQWVRAQPGYGQTPVLMITAMSERSFINQSFAAGATDYVTKPFNPAELSTRLEQAARLNRERRAPETAATPAPADALAIVHVPHFAFETPFNIAEVGGVLEFLALENYLLQLGRGGMMASACFAFRLRAAQQFYDSCTADEYYYTMADIAEALSETLRHHDSFVAHAGQGRFICLSHGRTLSDPQELEITLRNRIEAMNLQYDNGQPMPVALDASPILHLGLRSGPAALEQVDHALHLAGNTAAQPHQADPELVQPGQFLRSFIAPISNVIRRMRQRLVS